MPTTTAPTPAGTPLRAPVLTAELAAEAGAATSYDEGTAAEVGADLDEWVAGHAAAGYRGRILGVAERASLGMMVAISACAVIAARNGGSFQVHPLALVMWGLGASVSGVALASLATDPTAASESRARRLATGTALLLALLGCMTGVVAAADGVAGPAWVLMIPVVVVVGAVTGEVPGLLAGGLASGGVYAAAAMTHTLTDAGVGRLIMLLPAFPAAGIAAGALCGAARRAAIEAGVQRRAIEKDLNALSAFLDAVAEGDLTQTPSLLDPAHPATGGLAVVMADTLVALRRLVRRLGDSNDALVGSAHELAGSASDQVRAVLSQANAVSETTSTVEQLAATASSIALTADRVSRSADQCRVDADAGFAAVASSQAASDGLATRIANLSDRAQHLDALVARIEAATRGMDDLARRVTMLALNAAIEAAAVDEHAAGFANVAKEVRSLADKARASTGQITAIIAELHTEVAATAEAAAQGALAMADGVNRQQEVAHALARITKMIDETTVAAHEITEATRQQRQAAEAVVLAMSSVTESSGHARTATQRHSEAADRLLDLGEHVRTVISRFRLAGSAADGQLVRSHDHVG